MRGYRVTVNGTEFRFELPDLVEEAKREYDLRKQVYPKLVQNGRLNWDEADRRIALMKTIWKLLERQAQLEGVGQQSLFEEVKAG